MKQLTRSRELKIPVEPTEFYQTTMNKVSCIPYIGPFYIKLERNGSYWGLYNVNDKRIDGAQMHVFSSHLKLIKPNPLIKLLLE